MQQMDGMDAYTDFAAVYDLFMDGTPYQEWAAFLCHLISQYGVQEKRDEESNVVLDLGCGTGTLTELLAENGYDMIGIDGSWDMLRIATAKKEDSGHDILYLCQDMREFELYGTVGTVISVCDSLNYLLEEADLLQVFALVNNYLYPGGIFIFDFNTVYKYETVIGETTIAENREEGSFIWENYYDEDSGINEYDLTFYVKRGQTNGEDCYQRFAETHYQRGYTLPVMKRLLKQAGLLFLTAMDGETHGEVTEQSERIYVIAREAGKEKTNE